MTRRFLESLIALCQAELEALPPEVPPSVWPNEPPGWRVLSDQPWSSGLIGSGWNYLKRSTGKDSTITTDATAPISGPSVLRMTFPTTLAPDTAPCVHWIALGKVRAVYAAWTMKLSPNWTPSPAGAGKLAFIHSDGRGQVYSNLGGGTGTYPHWINVNTEWMGLYNGQKFWEPNIRKTPIEYGRWHKLEWFLKASTTETIADGVIRWWVDGDLNGDHRVMFPNVGLEQFEFSPTRQRPPLTEQHLLIDHTRLSVQP